MNLHFFLYPHSIVKEITYDTFGTILSDTNTSLNIPFGFAGGLHDRDTNLVHFGYREYDPQTPKWTAKDPIDFSGGDSNLYGYVLGDPVGFVDPTGLRDPRLNIALGSPVDKAIASRKAAQYLAGASAVAASTNLPYSKQVAAGLSVMSALSTANAHLLDLESGKFSEGSLTMDILTTSTDMCTKHPLIEFGYDELFNKAGPYIFDY